MSAPTDGTGSRIELLREKLPELVEVGIQGLEPGAALEVVRALIADLQQIEERLLHASPMARTRTVEVQGRSGVYRVTLMDDSPVACTCPGFEYRAVCRHLSMATAQVRQSG